MSYMHFCLKGWTKLMEQEMTLDLLELYVVLKSRYKFILTTGLTAALITGFFSFFILTPIYESKTRIIIGKETGQQTTQSDVMMFQNLMKTYAEIAQSDSTAQLAAKSLGNSTDYKELQKSTDVQNQTGTQILLITATDSSPTLVAKKVNAMANAFIENSSKLLPTGTVNIMDKGTVPEYPVKPNKKLNLVIAFLLGVVVSVGITLVLEFIDRTVKSEKDIEKYLQIPIIGVIPKHGAGN